LPENFNHVNLLVLGACNNFFEEDGVTKASCPLEKGKTYVYKNTFEILEVYPKVRVQVHWALTDAKTNKDIICFEIPARIS
jgi:Niemann-Pick C2 protein